ncbi:MAG: hypothetical protein ACFB0B_22035 [Thermonemataceae bacterium]
MKYLLIIGGLLGIISQGVAQESSFTERMSKETCECITNKVETTKEINAENVMQDCMTAFVMENMADFAKEYGDALNDQDQVQKLGLELGMKLMQECPAFMQVAVQSRSGLDYTTERNSNRTKGSFTKLTKDAYPYIEVLTEGNTEKFYVVDEFEGYENVMYKSKELSNKNITLLWENRSIWMPKAKAFEEVKVLTKVTVAE